MELNIYSKDGSLKLTVSPSDSSTVTEEVGGEYSVSLSFDTFEFRPIEVNDYIEVAGVRYKARMAYRPKMRNRQSYSYSLRFYAPIHDAQQALMKTETDGGLISEFSLWGGPREHLQKWVDNMNRLAGSELWTIGSVLTGENKNIDYRNVNCWDAAFGSNGIASTYETEMWADGYVINLCKCERGERITLGYGAGLTSLTPEDNSDKVRFFTRLFPLGSTRNINVSTYGFSRLQLPSRATFVDHNTDCYGVFEDSEEDAFAGIFPQYIGTVTAVRSESKTDENGKKFTVYYIKDSGMTWEPQALPEQTFMLSFQTGDLQGYGDDTNKSFQAEWHKDTKEWEIINIWLDDNTQIPGGNIVPIVGNQYFPWNMVMPQEYITEAEKRYEAAVNDFVANYSGEPVAYSGSTDYIHCAKQAVPLRIGQNVRLESDLYFEDGFQNTRITKVVRKLCRLTDATVTFAEQIGTGWKKSVDNQLSSLHYELQRQAEQASIDVIKTTDTKTPSDNNVFSALRSLATFLRKDKADTANEIITFNKGAKFGNFRSGTLGSGGSVSIDENGGSHAEFDYLTVRKKALFTEVTIQELKHIGGSLIISPASMVISKVEETSNGYKCYFATTDNDGRKIYNQFEVGDQARCQTFNLEELGGGLKGNRYWWRLVTQVGEDYIVLSKTDADTGSDIPAVGDNVSQLGNRTDASRQNAQIYSAYGDDAPSRVMYQGINSFSLAEKAIKYEGYDITTNRFKEETYGDAYFGDREKNNFMSYSTENGVEVKGKVTLEQGSVGAGNLEDLPEVVSKAVSVGSENLLRNTGFVGSYNPKDLKGADDLTEDTEMYSESLEYWSGDAIVMQDSESLSGYAAKIYSLTQSVTLIPNEKYTISYKAKNGTISFNVGGSIVSNALTSEYKRYNHTVTASDSTFEIYGGGTVCEIKLERGTIATDWCPSVLDPAPVKDMFKDLWYLQSAMQGSTTTIGGLNLTSVILLGQFLNGEMQKVNAGVSGIYNDNDDVAFWAGGSLEEAIKTVQKLKDGYTPTDTEWNSLAKFVATHGGDLFLRGYIYALGGLFRGRVEAGNDERKVIINPENGSLEFYYMGKKRIDILYGQKLGSTSAISVNMYDEQGKNTAWMNQYGFYSKIAEDDQYEIVSVSNSEGVSFLKYPKTGIGRAGMIAKLGITVNEENVQLSKLFIYGNIPTSSDLLTLGQVYQEDGFLKVKTE